MKILAFGYNSIANTFNCPYKNWQVEKFIYHNIFAVTQDNSNENVSFCKTVNESNAEYLVTDLLSLSLHISIGEDNMYYTQRPQTSNDIKFQNKLFFNDKKACFDCIDKFITIISKKFDSKKIILVKNKRGNKYCKGQLARTIVNSNEDELNSRLSMYEDYFHSKTNCQVIDVFSPYFVDYYHPFGVSTLNYETFAYDHIKHCLSCIFEGKPITNPLSIKLKRYIKYGDFLNSVFRINWILSNDDIVEDFISLTSVSFVTEFYNDLIKLNQSIIKTPNELLKETESFCHETVINAVKWYVALTTNKFNNLTYNENLKKYNLVLENKLVSIINYHILACGIKNHDATIKNFDKYINYLTTGSIKLLSKSQDISQPTVIDIWGSCISREVFKFIDENVILNQYIYRSSGLQINDPEIDVPSEIFDDLTLFNGSRWRSDSLKNTLFRQTKERLSVTKAKWLIIDLYDFVELNYRIADNNFVLAYDTTKMPIYSYLQKHNNLKDIGFYPYKGQELTDRLNFFVEFISSVYGQNIILINTNFSSHYISNSGEIIRFNRTQGELDTKNNYLKYCQEYLTNKLDCYVLDLSDKFLADERFVWGESPVHYETEFFKYAGLIIRNILNGKTNQKKFDILPAELSAKRILGILERIRQYGGKNAPKHYEILSNSIDNNIIKLYNESMYNIEKLSN